VPTPLVGRIDLDKLYPPFLERFLDLIAVCQDRGANYFATLGFRSFEEQDRLYAQGRTVQGKKVTNARGGMSPHCYGLAVDVVRDADLAKVGLQPYWARDGYELLWKEAQPLGLETGFFWKFSDSGHVQIPRPDIFETDGDFYGHLKHIYDTSGLKGVWSYLDGVGV
jgi:peptidoglycan L-alanyl-D-glutamate endopeptidase CwlK